ncbi:HipA domain-containing protein [Planococcus maritimus]|uniref:HipA domain-containing protein n=1 Tax=Planococcus maritimus TaxID=192421 RepID=UPI00201D3F99|nr:HipA domain-containing protein [Planococcus maritimus]
MSDWIFSGYGVDSTLEKHDLLSPENFPNEPEGHRRYIIKYPRTFKVGVSWEDITELVASQIGKLLGLKMMDVEIVIRNGRRGALLKNFVPYRGQFLEGGSILSDLDEYESFEILSLESEELIIAGFEMMEKLSFWNEMKKEYIAMNYFDILIGNQDRHPFNWMMLYYEDGEKKFSPIYDNGASLGFRFDEEKLKVYLSGETQLRKYIRQTKVKAGLFEKKKVKAQDLIKVMKNRYIQESDEIIFKIDKFDFHKYENYINKKPYLSENQKEWLKLIISQRREYVLEWYKGE